MLPKVLPVYNENVCDLPRPTHYGSFSVHGLVVIQRLKPAAIYRLLCASINPHTVSLYAVPWTRSSSFAANRSQAPSRHGPERIARGTFCVLGGPPAVSEIGNSVLSARRAVTQCAALVFNDGSDAHARRGYVCFVFALASGFSGHQNREK